VHSRFVSNLLLTDLATIYWLVQKSLLCTLPTKDALFAAYDRKTSKYTHTHTKRKAEGEEEIKKGERGSG
jgi:hypothetical protein